MLFHHIDILILQLEFSTQLIHVLFISLVSLLSNAPTTVFSTLLEKLLSHIIEGRLILTFK